MISIRMSISAFIAIMVLACTAFAAPPVENTLEKKPIKILKVKPGTLQVVAGSSSSALKNNDRRFSWDAADYALRPVRVGEGGFVLYGSLNPAECLSFDDLPTYGYDWDGKSTGTAPVFSYWDAQAQGGAGQWKSMPGAGKKILAVAYLTCNPPTISSGADLYDCGKHGAVRQKLVYAKCYDKVGANVYPAGKFHCAISADDVMSFLHPQYPPYAGLSGADKVDKLLSDEFDLKLALITGFEDTSIPLEVFPKSVMLPAADLIAALNGKDADGDGVPSGWDNCPDVQNVNQSAGDCQVDNFNLIKRTCPAGFSESKFHKNVGAYGAKIEYAGLGSASVRFVGIFTDGVLFDSITKGRYDERIGVWVSAGDAPFSRIRSNCEGINQGRGFQCSFGIPELAKDLGMSEDATLAAFEQGDESVKVYFTAGSGARCLLCRSPEATAKSLQGGETIDDLVHDPHAGQDDGVSIIDKVKGWFGVGDAAVATCGNGTLEMGEECEIDSDCDENFFCNKNCKCIESVGTIPVEIK